MNLETIQKLQLAIEQHHLDLSPFEEAVESWKHSLIQARDCGVLIKSMRNECDDSITEANVLLQLIQTSKEKNT